MNPEFHRQLWLGFSVTRLVVLPLLLLACFTLAFLSARANAADVLAMTGSAMFALLVWGMGTLAAGSSVIDEITDRTWDQQRMSAMQPWAMTWGKLGGATAYGWYGGALCLGVPLFLVRFRTFRAPLFGVPLFLVRFRTFRAPLSMRVCRARPLATRMNA